MSFYMKYSIGYFVIQWLRSFDQRLRESIDYALCLNSIGSSSNELWLHVSKPPESEYIKQIYDVHRHFYYHHIDMNVVQELFISQMFL